MTRKVDIVKSTLLGLSTYYLSLFIIPIFEVSLKDYREISCEVYLRRGVQVLFGGMGCFCSPNAAGVGGYKDREL